jgi:hypothetical protein
VPADLPPDDIAKLMTETASPFGRIGHFKPVLELDRTPGFYASPPEPFGTSKPEWGFIEL